VRWMTWRAIFASPYGVRVHFDKVLHVAQTWPAAVVHENIDVASYSRPEHRGNCKIDMALPTEDKWIVLAMS
jgi:hypothetical protein